MRKVAVYVQSIRKEGNSVVVSATNGGPDGPPKVDFELRTEDIGNCHIGKRYYMTIEEDLRNA